MSAFSDLPAADRAEIDRAIQEAFEDSEASLLTGTPRVRTRADATEHFLQFIASATQAHREYADALRREWEEAGASAFVVQRWKALQTVHFRGPDGSAVPRPARRGTRVIDDSGVTRYVQLHMLSFDRDALERGIVEAAQRIESEQITIATYRHLLHLLDETGATFVQEGLDAKGMSLDEYLASREAGAA